MAKHLVKCKFCGKTFDANLSPFVKLSNRYAHQECYDLEKEQYEKDEKDRIALEEYILKLFNVEQIPARIRQQIGQYMKEYNYTYSGIHKALVYFYEVKKNDIQKAHEAIGIVPFCYQDAYRYYYAIWEAQEKNKEKVVSDFVQEETVIRIPVPQRKIKKRKLFSFFDEE